MSIWWLVAILAVGSGVILLIFNTTWIGLFDRARRNGRDRVPEEYERPRYFRLRRGSPEVDLTVRWPGWDGWYFVVIPDRGRDIPTQMVRGSLMTGLYGLEGIDNLDKLDLRLDTRLAAEYLLLAPTHQHAGNSPRRENNLLQLYLPRATGLRMAADRLETTVSYVDPTRDEALVRYGRVSGTWPDYRLEFENPEAGIRVRLNYRGKDLVWWADLPGVFTYFSAFGRFSGEIHYDHGTRRNSDADLTGAAETFPIEGFGAFEHGFARKPFEFDLLFAPFRLWKQLFPAVQAIRYHYEILLSDDGSLHGGLMQAKGFGITFREHGGLHEGDTFSDLRRMRVTYDPQSAQTVAMVSGNPDVTVYRRWRVSAATSGGSLDYEAEREFPPAMIAEGMLYYHFTYKGTWKGKPIQGRGYGEYVSL